MIAEKWLRIMEELREVRPEGDWDEIPEGLDSDESRLAIVLQIYQNENKYLAY